MSTPAHELIKETEHLPVYFDVGACGDTAIPAHWHNYLEIVYLLKGRMTAVIQAEKYSLHPGDLLIINCKDLHMTRKETPETEYMLLQISRQQLLQFFSDFDSIRFSSFIAKDTLASENALKGFLTGLIQIFSEKEDGYPLLFTARLYDLLYVLYRKYSFRQPADAVSRVSRDMSRMARIIDWLQENYRQPLTLTQAAHYLGLSKEYFCRIFKQYTGQTFLEYLNMLRIISFYQDLYSSDLSIPLLMEKNGITNYKLFLRLFRKIYGATPQKARKERI